MAEHLVRCHASPLTDGVRSNGANPVEDKDA
jgi:hypothetical protein